jgi:hypothetical protein
MFYVLAYIRMNRRQKYWQNVPIAGKTLKMQRKHGKWLVNPISKVKGLNSP